VKSGDSLSEIAAGWIHAQPEQTSHAVVNNHATALLLVEKPGHVTSAALMAALPRSSTAGLASARPLQHALELREMPSAATQRERHPSCLAQRR
jgi:hypothetical protein